MSGHGIRAAAEIRGGPAVSHSGVHGIAVLQSVEAAAWGNCGIQVGGGQCETRKAEGIGGIRLLCRDHATPGPLISTIRAGKRDCAHYPITIHYRAPHIEAEAAVLLMARE